MSTDNLYGGTINSHTTDTVLSIAPVCQFERGTLFAEAMGVTLPFILRYAEQAQPSISGDDTIWETSTETSTDGKIDDDTADDTDVGGLDPQTGLLADSGTAEDEE